MTTAPIIVIGKKLDVTQRCAIFQSIRCRWFNNDVCKNEKKLLERLDQAILDVINNPKKIQKTACIGTLL